MLLVFLLFHFSSLLVLAIPSWQGASSRDQIGSMVPGAEWIEVYGPVRGDFPTYVSSTASQGVPGNLTGYFNKNPPRFYIDHGSLYQLINETTVLTVDIVNRTLTQPNRPPFQMVLSTKKTDLKSGVWRWRGTGLLFSHNGIENNGLYFHCKTHEGHGLYPILSPGKPAGCEVVTLHSFNREKRQPAR